MALTPEDVVKKEFSKPKGFGRNGYDEIQVDDFLDEIVVELRRLNAENDSLSDKLDDCRRSHGGDGDATMAGQSKTTAVPALTPVNNAAAPAAGGSSDEDKAEIARLKKELETSRTELDKARAPKANEAADAGQDAASADLTSARRDLQSAREEAKNAQAKLAEADARITQLELSLIHI